MPAWSARGWRALGLLALVAGLAAGGAGAQTAPAAVPVGTAAVESRPITGSLSVVGRVEAVDRVDLQARIDGFIEEVAFREGDHVAEGALLYRLESGQFAASVRAAEGALAQRRAEKDLADLQFARAQELMEKNTGTVVARDQAKAEADRSAGAVETAEADLATARINLGYTEVRAPIAGRIGRTALTKGAVVGPSSGVLATIVSEDPMHVTFPVSMRELLRQNRGGQRPDPASIKVSLRFADGSVYRETGTIDFVDVTVDQATDAVLGRSTIANPDATLIDGQLVTVLLESGAPVEELVVPQAALIADQGGVYVFVVEDGKAAVRRIRPSGTVGADAVVAEGLAAGEQVIVEGIERIRPGAAVIASPVAASLGSN